MNRLGYACAIAMTADEILEHVRALPPRERLKLVERVMHEVAEQTPATPPVAAQGSDAIWADVGDAEFEAFMQSIRSARSEPWRSTG
jgi:hypothetical protein